MKRFIPALFFALIFLAIKKWLGGMDGVIIVGLSTILTELVLKDY